MGPRPCATVAVMVALLWGCGDDAAPGMDGGGDGGPVGVVVDPPAPPDFGACPTGWTSETLDDGVVVCEPWPASGRADCGPHEAHFPGEAGCVPVGGACPPGDFAEDVPADRPTVFVRPGGTGDGSRGSPYGTVAEAVAAAPTGAVVAVGRGNYDEAVRIDAPLSLWGACASGTRIASSAPSDSAGSVSVGADEVLIRNLELGGDLRPGLWVEGADASADVEQAVVAGAGDAGIASISGARVTIRDTLVRDVQLLGSNGGYGLWAYLGSTLDVMRVAVLRAGGAGIVAYDGANAIRIEQTVVADAEGRGFDVNPGGTGEVVASAIEGNRSLGLYVAGVASTLSVTDSVVRRQRPELPTMRAGRGLSVNGGARAELRRTLLAENLDVGIMVNETDSALLLEDAVVRDTEGRAVEGASGRGVTVQFSATAEMRRVVLDRNRDHGVILARDSTARLEDVIIRDTRSRGYDSNFGRGLSVESQSSVTATRVLLEGNREASLYASGLGTDVVAEHFRIVDTLPKDCPPEGCGPGTAGMGMGIYRGAAARIATFAVLRAELCGAHLAGDAALDLTMGEVRECTIGACVQVPDYAFGRLTEDVVFLDNDTNLETTDLPIPGVTDT